MEPLYQHNSQPVVGQGSYQSSLTLPSSMVYYGSDYAQYTSGHGGPTYGNVHSNAIHNSAMHNNLALNGGSQIAGAPAGINGGNHLTQAAHLGHGEQPFYQNAYYSYTSPSGSVSSNSSAASIHQNNQAQSQGHAHLHAQGSQAQAQGPTSAPAASIDYSSLVSYTVSPRLKRKRRSNQAVSAAGTVTTSIAAVSTEPESFTCNVCDKVFHKQYNLKSHMKTHSDDKPFACSKCPKRFARSHDKKRHESLHEGVKNFKCQGYLKDGCSKWGCGKQFARSDALARHFRTETGWLCIKPLMDEAKKLDGGVVGVGGAGAVNFGINLANASLANFGQGYDYEGGMALEDDFDSTLLRRMLPTTRM